MLTIQSLEYLKQYREKRVKLIWFLPGNCIVLLESEYPIVIYTIRKYFQDFFWWQKFDNTLLCFWRILHFLNHITETCKICESCCVFLSVSFPILFLSFYLSIYIRYFIMHQSSFLHSRLIHHSTTSVDVLSVV